MPIEAKMVSQTVKECLVTASDYDYLVAANKVAEGQAMLAANQEYAMYCVKFGWVGFVVFIIVWVLVRLNGGMSKLMIDEGVFANIKESAALFFGGVSLAFAITFFGLAAGKIFFESPGIKTEVIEAQSSLATKQKPAADILVQCVLSEEDLQNNGVIRLLQNPEVTESSVGMGSSVSEITASKKSMWKTESF